MAYSRLITAPKIHNGQQWLPAGTVLEVNETGRIEAIHSKGSLANDHIRHYEGVLCPGFVNAHCHLELSHMQGCIEEGNGLVSFLIDVMKQRNRFSAPAIRLALEHAMATLKENGVVALGDIANGTDTLNHRENAGFHIHTFIECIGFNPEQALDRFRFSEKIYEQFAIQAGGQQLLRQSIVPHAPYSVTQELFRHISGHQPQSLQSIHNEETMAEQELYQHKAGAMFDLFEALRIEADAFIPSGKTSLQTYVPWIGEAHPLILVHNTFMNQQDIDFLKHSGRKFTLCLCPNANWYIERRLPDVAMLLKNDVVLCLGTDSLASNYSLDMLSEMARIQEHYPQVTLAQLLCWATYNGAQALNMEQHVGSIAVGKAPGILHVSFKAHQEALSQASVAVVHAAVV